MNRKNLLLSMAPILILSTITLAQPPATLWEVIHGGSSQDYCNDVLEVEGGFIFAGSTLSYGAGNEDMYLVKTDFEGNILWEQTYGTTDEEECLSIAQSADGGFVLGGFVCYSTGPKDVYLVKTDFGGNLEWERTFDNGQFDVCESVRWTPDGGYILGGYTYTGDDEDMLLLKTDAQGNQLWLQTYGGPDYDRCTSCIPTMDGGYALAGYTHWFGPIGSHGTLIKTDSQGVALWEATFTGQGCTYINDAQLAQESGLILTGSTALTSSFPRNIYLLKTDDLGNPEWERYIGADMFDEYGNAVQATSEGGYIVAGCAYINIMTEYQMYAIKTDAQGNETWSNHWGGMQWEEGMGVAESTQGGYILGGFTNSPPTASAFDMYLVRLEGSLMPEMAVTLTPESVPVLIPPGGGTFSYTLDIENVGMSPAVFDAWIEADLPNGSTFGPIILREENSLPAGGSITRDMTQEVPSGAPAGSYMYRLNVGDYPDAVYASDEFQIVKAITDGSYDGGEWTLYGWEEEGVSMRADAELPQKHRLVGNYPNPFNPETKIMYELAEQASVELSIFNTMGRRVTTLVNRIEEAGAHEVAWSGRDYPAGIYLARLTVGNEPAQIHELVLVK